MKAQIKNNRKKLSSAQVGGCNVAPRRIFRLLCMVIKDIWPAKVDHSSSPYASKLAETLTAHNLNMFCECFQSDIPLLLFSLWESLNPSCNRRYIFLNKHLRMLHQAQTRGVLLTDLLADLHEMHLPFRQFPVSRILNHGLSWKAHSSHVGPPYYTAFV